jgi:hypothetical protein
MEKSNYYSAFAKEVKSYTSRYIYEKIGIFKIIAIIILFLYLGTIDIIPKNRIGKNIQTSQNYIFSNTK